jgi:hypothetical protein
MGDERSLYRVDSLMIVLKELFKYKLDLVVVQEVRWEGGGTEPAGEYTFFCRQGNYNFNAKVGREDIFKPTIGNKSFHESSNAKGVRLVNFATCNNLTVERIMFPHHNNYKYT